MADSSPRTKRTTRTGFLLVLGIALLYTGIALLYTGIALLYTGIALANTFVTATSDRARELALLRLAGTTGGQVLRLVAGESLTVVLVGAATGTLVAALNLAGIHGALRLLDAGGTIVVPWDALGATTAACAAVAVVSAVVPAGLCLRRRAVDLAGLRD
ncbi:FtsX-like permease family protein [Streptomyces erythrochromogenes]|uniref:FtsX-like permease family protein n=1 Tax=Streptomyces erythrochromogenes TaxID=285574 RepID=UPI00381BA49C